MSETDQDDTQRRQRARFVDALTTQTRQPGERSRVGTRAAGAAAVLALAAGATLGLGAWRSYQADENDKKQELAAEQAASYKKLAQPSSQAPLPKPTKSEPTEKTQQPELPVVREEAPAPRPVVTSSPSPKATLKPGITDVRALTAKTRTVLVKNASTGMCVDIPYYKAGKLGLQINQYYCDGTDADNQLWKMTAPRPAAGPGGRDLVQFANAKDGLCIDLPNRGAQPEGTVLSEAHCTGTMGDNQLWWFEAAGDDTVWIRNYASNHLCLQVQGADEKKPAQRLLIGKCGAHDDSRWRVTG